MPPARIAYMQSRSWVDVPCCSASLRFYPARPVNSRLGQACAKNSPARFGTQ